MCDKYPPLYLGKWAIGLCVLLRHMFVSQRIKRFSRCQSNSGLSWQEPNDPIWGMCFAELNQEHCWKTNVCEVDMLVGKDVQY